MKNITELQEMLIVNLYNDGLSLREIAKLYETDKSLIKRRLQKHSVVFRSLSEANRTYSFDENIFENIDSHEKAYWLGFIAADGNVCKNSLKIGLSSKDIKHLEKFKFFLKSNHPIHIYHPKIKDKVYESCEFSVHSDKIVNDLLKLNITPNKSKTLPPPPIDSKYINSYILGIVDGDGCFSIDKKGQSHLNIISSLPMCQFIMETLVRECNITPTKILEEKRSLGSYYCYFGGNKKIRNIIDFIYRDAHIYLERKRNIIK